MNAIILAGGRGTRLAPWHAPKCLLPVNGVPILNRILEHLFEADSPGKSVVNKAIVCTGYRADDVEAAIDTWGWLEQHVRVSFAGEDAPMGERLLKARELTDGGRCLILYGDELADVNIETLLNHHIRHHVMMTFVAAPQRVTGGVVCLPTPTINNDYKVWVNIGFLTVEPHGWGWLKREDGLSDWINRAQLMLTGAVNVYQHDVKRATINTLADLKAAEEMWK